ncbi:MerR family transcriptional regulator [Actinophytocola sediminis]
MRVAELSSRTGVPIPTIKYYLREGLLPAGVLTSPNQAHYDETHVRRLRLVRALVEVGGLSIEATRTVLAKIRGADGPLNSIGKAQFAIGARVVPHEDAAHADALRRVDELIERRGWRVRASNPARATMAEALAYLTRLGHQDALPLVERYADAAQALAEPEVALVTGRRNVDGMAETAVVLTVLGDALLSALRRMAQESDATDRLS